MRMKVLSIVSVMLLNINTSWSARQSCPEEKFKRSQALLGEFFNNYLCHKIKIDQVEINDLYCSEVAKCNNSQSFNDAIPESDRKFLRSHSYQFLRQQSVIQEMEKYNSEGADKFRAILAYMKEEKKEVKCEPPVLEGDQCVSHPMGDRVVKSKIYSLYHEAMAVDSLDDKTKNRCEKNFSRFDASSKKTDESVEVKFKKWFGEIKNEIPMSDLAADEINLSITYSVENMLASHPELSNLSVDKMKPILSTLLLDISKNDPILGYNPSAINSIIEEALNKDFFSDLKGKKDIAGDIIVKVNDLRFGMANKYMASDCGKFNLTIAQVCRQVEETFKRDDVIRKFDLDSSNILDRLIDHYTRNSDDNEQKREEIRNNLKIVRQNDSPNYQKYLGFLLQVSACDMRDNNLDPEIVAITESAEKSALESAKRSRQDTIDSLGYTPNVIVKKSMQTSNVSIPAENGIAPKENYSKLISNVAEKISTPIAQTASTPKTSTQVRSESSNSGFRAVDTNISDNAKGAEIDESLNRNLRSKLAELEAKEKLVARQLSEAGANTGLSESAELQKLKAEIEELRSQTKTEKARSDASPPSGKSSLPSKSTASGKSSITNKALSDFAVKSADVSAARVASQAVEPGAQANGDTAQNAASRSISPSVAPTAPHAGGEKLKNGSEAIASGIVLSKSGVAQFDPATILNDPNEADIVSIIDQTQGQPFLIRENGVLKKVTVHLDLNGRPQLAGNGKPLYKKVPITQTQVENFIKEAAAQKSLKEVGRDPARLYNLKSLLKETVQRE